MAQHRDQRNVDELPCDVFFNILSRLHVVHLLNCKFVSSQWRNSVQDPDFAGTHVSRPPDVDNLSLVVQSKYRFSTSNPLHMIPIEDSDSDTRAQTIKRLKIPYQWLMRKFRVIGSSNGFLCLYDTANDGPVFLFNPYTRESHKLPEIGFTAHLLLDSPTVVFGFGFDPTTNDYKVVKVIYDRVLHFSMGQVPVNSQVWILTLGDRKWRRINSTSYRLFGLCSEVLIDGKLHWLAQSDNSDEVQIVSFDLHREEFQTVPHPVNLRPPLGCAYYHHLVKSRGCLSIVATRPDETTEVWTMKRYNVEESWTKEFVIDKHVLEGSQFRHPATGSMKNSSSRKYVQVICHLQSGEVLLLYSSRKLVAFHPQHRTFRPVEFDGLPYKFHLMVHSGSLLSMNAPAINK